MGVEKGWCCGGYDKVIGAEGVGSGGRGVCHVIGESLNGSGEV